MCFSQNPQNHNFHSDFIIPHPHCHRWKILWICSLPTVGVPGRGHESSLAGNGEVTPESTWSWAHRRRETAELQDWVWEFHPSSAAVLAKQSWEIKENMFRCFWSWNEEFPVLLSTSLLKNEGAGCAVPIPAFLTTARRAGRKGRGANGRWGFVLPSLFPLLFPCWFPLLSLFPLPQTHHTEN